MGSGGSGTGGSSIAGTTSTYLGLPFKNYRDLDLWFEELINALAANLEVDEQRFITAQARANLLDPTYTPPYPAESTLATATAAPTGGASQDSMLDLLAAVALSAYPLNQNFTVAERQAMVATGGSLQRRKGSRQALLQTAAAACAQAIAGWTVPPYNFSIILPDGLASPGWGAWSPVSVHQAGTAATTSGSNAVVGTSTAFTSQWLGYRIAFVSGSTVLTDWVASVTNATHLTTSGNLGSTLATADIWVSPGASFRPWILEALRQVLDRFFPAWSALGIGFSQFRAGYSAAGETILPDGAQIGRLANPSFDLWSGASPTSWTVTGSGTLQRSATVAEINYEFTASAAQIDLSSAAPGIGVVLSQSATINNQLSHRLEVDYAYTNGQLVNTLTLQIIDNTNGNSWNGSEWVSGTVSIPLPVSSGAAVRVRYATNVTMQANSSSATTLGTAAITIRISATSDGTATTKVVYTIYRCDLLPMHSTTVEAEAGGERTLWLPLVDQLGLTLAVASGSATIIEPANATRSAVKLVTGTRSEFPYHPALTGRGFRSRTSWANLLAGSCDFTSDWGQTNCTATASSQISPVVGETSATATLLAATATGALVNQTAIVADPSSKSYLCGVWVKKLSTDGNFTDVTLSLISGGTTKAQAFTLLQSEGWKLLTFEPQTFGVGDVNPLEFRIAFGAASANGQIAVYGAYVYEVTGKTGVLYPPVVVSPVGSTASTGTRACKAISSSQDINVLDPGLLRPMVSITRGALQLTVVPAFDANSQPDQVLFDFGESTTKNRVTVAFISGYLGFQVLDDASALSGAVLALTEKIDPTSSEVTWLRDRPVVIRVRWNDDGSVSMSANGSSTSGPAIGGWSPVETSIAKISVGCTITDAEHFDGIVTLADVLQVGAPPV